MFVLLYADDPFGEWTLIADVVTGIAIPFAILASLANRVEPTDKMQTIIFERFPVRLAIRKSLLVQWFPLYAIFCTGILVAFLFLSKILEIQGFLRIPAFVALASATIVFFVWWFSQLNDLARSGIERVFFDCERQLYKEYNLSMSSPRDPNELFKAMEDSDSKSLPDQHLRGEIVKFQSIVPGLPPLPARSLEYEGWFQEVKKRIARRGEQRSMEEQKEVVRRYNDLYKEYLDLAKTHLQAEELKNEVDVIRQRSELSSLKVDVERSELQAKKRMHDLEMAKYEAEIQKLKNPSSPPPPVPPSIVDQKKVELELAQIEAQIQRIKNPPAPPDKSKPYDSITRKLEIIRELEAEWKKQIEKASTDEERDRINILFEEAIEKAKEGQKL